MPKVGDIVKALEHSPYALTAPGTKWIVYDMEPGVFMRVGQVPESLELFNTNVQLFVSAELSPTRRRNNRMAANFRLYSVDSKYFTIVGRLGNNVDYAKLLSQGDIWAEEVKLPKRRPKPWHSVNNTPF